jgi:putative lipoic acid-binding regulatory protein
LLIILLRMDNKSEEFYVRLKEELAKSTEWPSEYLYKFIVPTDGAKIIQIEEAFNNMGAVIDTRASKNGKYTSVSINVRMDSAQAVIDKYVQMSSIEGIISL